MKKLDHSDDDGKDEDSLGRVALSFRKKFQCQNAELVPNGFALNVFSFVRFRFLLIGARANVQSNVG